MVFIFFIFMGAWSNSKRFLGELGQNLVCSQTSAWRGPASSPFVSPAQNHGQQEPRSALKLIMWAMHGNTFFLDNYAW
jgi:hypothetical protein